jgi:hypothetical protein
MVIQGLYISLLSSTRHMTIFLSLFTQLAPMEASRVSTQYRNRYLREPHISTPTRPSQTHSLPKEEAGTHIFIVVPILTSEHLLGNYASCLD